MTKKFSYIQAGLWYRPIVPVTLRYNNKEVSYLALIDSGADFNIFHADLAGILGINLSKLKRTKFSGISKSTKEPEGCFVELDIEIGGVPNKCMILFSNDISDDGYGILGQQGFFNSFKVSFNYVKREIEIKSNSSGNKRN